MGKLSNSARSPPGEPSCIIARNRPSHNHVLSPRLPAEKLTIAVVEKRRTMLDGRGGCFFWSAALFRRFFSFGFQHKQTKKAAEKRRTPKKAKPVDGRVFSP
ncbi:MAG TPA: hypothetical protein VMG10_32360 [Gemmataceae bacterium]|nr:hypothetical protein [Gemmataceae bacterium]